MDGDLLFNVWDDLEKNQLCAIADRMLKAQHPDEHDDFFRLPYSLHDRLIVSSLLQDTGFSSINYSDVSIVCHWSCARDAAVAIIEGSPIAGIILSRGGQQLLQDTIAHLESAYEGARATMQMCCDRENDGRIDSNTSRISFIMNAIAFHCKKEKRSRSK